MRHMLFKGDEITVRTSDSVEVAIGLDGGVDLYFSEGDEMTIEKVHHNGITALWQPEGGRFVDVEVFLRFCDFIHDHAVCEDSLDNLDAGDDPKWYTDGVRIEFETFHDSCGATCPN